MTFTWRRLAASTRLVFTLPVSDELRKAYAGEGVSLLALRPLPRLLGALLYAGLAAVLAKGAGHKYVRKIRGPNGKWRYYYTVTGGGGLGHHEEFHEGAKFALTHNGQAGHFEVVGKEDDGKLRIRHDESGHVEELDPDVFRQMLHREHATALDDHAKRTAADLAAARKHGSDKQRARLEAHAKRYAHTQHLSTGVAQKPRLAVPPAPRLKPHHFAHETGTQTSDAHTRAEKTLHDLAQAADNLHAGAGSVEAVSTAEARAVDALSQHERAGNRLRNRRSTNTHRDVHARLRGALAEIRQHTEEAAKQRGPEFDRAGWEAWSAQHKGQALAGLSNYADEALTGNKSAALPPHVRAAFGDVPVAEVVKYLASKGYALGKMKQARHAFGYQTEPVTGLRLAEFPLDALKAIAKSGKPNDASSAQRELRERQDVADALGVPIEEVQPKAGVHGDHIVDGYTPKSLAAGTLRLRELAAGGDKHATAELQRRRAILHMLGHDLDRLDENGKHHPVWGADEIVAPGGVRFRHRGVEVPRFGGGMISVWSEVAVDGGTVDSRTNKHTRDALEATYGAGAMKAPLRRPDEHHHQKVASLIDAAASPAAAGELSEHALALAGAGGKVIEVAGERLPITHFARAAEGVRARRPNPADTPKWHEQVGDADLNTIVSELSRDEAPTFHAEHEARQHTDTHKAFKGEKASMTRQTPKGPLTVPAEVMGGYAVHKTPAGWAVSHAASGYGMRIHANTRAEAIHAAALMYSQTGALPDDPEAAGAAFADTDVRQEAQRHLADGIARRAAEYSRQLKLAHSVLEGRKALHELDAAAPAKRPKFAQSVQHREHTQALRRAFDGVSRGAHPNISGVYYNAAGEAVSTDGYRLMIVPARDVPADWKGTLRDKSGKEITSATGEHPRFPTYEDVIPRTVAHQEHVDAKHLDQVLQAAIATGLSNQVPAVRLERKGGHLYLHLPHDPHTNGHVVPEGGLHVSLGPSDPKAPDFKTAANVHYLRDAIKGARGTVRLGFNDPMSPITIERHDGERHIVMPIRI